MRSKGVSGGTGRRTPSARAPAVVPLDRFRRAKRVSRYLPVWIGTFCVLLLLGLLNASPGIFAGLPGLASDLFIKTATLVDRTSSPPQSVHFSLCHIGGGTNCVVDGDTFWMQGVKIRIADIDAPETHPSRCPREADLGNRATNRLQELLNAGPVALQASSREEDIYGRKLRIVSRNGASLGMRLVGEGLARAWDGSRHPWC